MRRSYWDTVCLAVIFTQSERRGPECATRASNLYCLSHYSLYFSLKRNCSLSWHKLSSRAREVVLSYDFTVIVSQSLQSDRNFLNSLLLS
jgi:hypothetical protein